jgi:hypothetical protein
MNSFELQLQELWGKHNPTEIDEIILDNFWENKESFTEEEKVVLEKYTCLTHLSVNNIGLKSFKNFPVIKSLYMLSVNDNELSGDDFDLLENCYPILQKLKINGNNIENINNFGKLKPLKLKKIEVERNPFSVGNNKYKNKLFEILPTLISVNHKDNVGGEVETTDYHKEEEESNEEYEDYDEGEELDDEGDENDEQKGKDEDYSEDSEKPKKKKKKENNTKKNDDDEDDLYEEEEDGEEDEE